MAKTRYLTQGEKHLCRHVFGKTIPRDDVEVIRRHGISGGFTPYGRINLDPTLYEEDFIGEDIYKPVAPPRKCHHFLHEMAHSWQHFVGVWIVNEYRKAGKAARQVLDSQGLDRRDYNRQDWAELKFHAMYSYDITAGSDLMDFTMEQQCEIIADYYALTLWSWQDWGSKWFSHPQPTQTQLEAVLATFRANPGYPRGLKVLNEPRARHRTFLAGS